MEGFVGRDKGVVSVDRDSSRSVRMTVRILCRHAEPEGCGRSVKASLVISEGWFF